MPFERPTLPDLITRISADLKSRLERTSPALRRAVRYVFSYVLSGAVHMLHGFLQYLARQLFADQSEDAYLVRQASLFGLSKGAATFASGSVTAVGTNGTVIPVNTVLRRADGAEFTTQGSVTVSFGVALIPVIAVLAGAAGNTDGTTVLTFESPIAGVNAEVTVNVGAIVGGADQETTEALRVRLLQRLRHPPEGGAEEDYRTWALGVPGVTRVWVYPQADGAGTVTVRFMRDDDLGDGFPSGGEVTEVQAYIDERRPVTASVTVLAPVVKLWSPTILITPDTPELRAAIEAEIEDLFLRVGEPGGTIKLWQLEDAINDVVGLTDYTVASPVADLTHEADELPSLYIVNWEL